MINPPTIIIIAVIIFIILNIYFSSKMGNKLAAGGKKTMLERIFTWDPPWAFSFKTIKRLEARSSWWRIITIPVRIIKVFDLVSVNEWTSIFLFALPFIILGYIIRFFFL